MSLSYRPYLFFDYFTFLFASLLIFLHFLKVIFALHFIFNDCDAAPAEINIMQLKLAVIVDALLPPISRDVNGNIDEMENEKVNDKNEEFGDEIDGEIETDDGLSGDKTNEGLNNIFIEDFDGTLEENKKNLTNNDNFDQMLTNFETFNENLDNYTIKSIETATISINKLTKDFKSNDKINKLINFLPNFNETNPILTKTFNSDEKSIKNYKIQARIDFELTPPLAPVINQETEINYQDFSMQPNGNYHFE